MKISSNQRGASYLIAVLALLVVGVIVLAGYRISQKNSSLSSSTAPGALHSASVPTKISSKADVKKADQALSQTSIDSGVNPNSLDTDLQAIL